MGLSFRIETAGKVGHICLGEAGTADGMGLVIVIDAAGCEDGAVDAGLGTTICEVESANYI